MRTERSRRRGEFRTVVHFVDGTSLPWTTGQAVADALAELVGSQTVDAFLRAFPGASFGPLYASSTPGKLDAIERRAAERTPGRESVDFKTHYQLTGVDDARRREAVEMLRSWPIVRLAYSYADPLRSPSPATADPLLPKQGFLERAQWGIDAPFAWAMVGGRGEDTMFVDVELGWKLDHADLPPGIEAVPAVDAPFDESLEERKHGASVLGIVVAQHNEIFAAGLAPSVPVVMVSRRLREGLDPVTNKIVATPNTPDAIHAAIEEIESRGLADRAVILIEAVADLIPDPDDPDLEEDEGLGLTIENWLFPLKKWDVPIEAIPTAYLKIKQATDTGITVVLAVGNDSVPLDDVRQKIGDGPKVAIFDRDERDSGAIYVGQAKQRAPCDGPHCVEHSSSSNVCFGERVDCFSWGEGIVTLDVGPDGEDDETFNFSDTSAASAVIAGAALLLQGIAIRHAGGPLSPADLRAALADRKQDVHTWFKVDDTEKPDVVGVMPDLRRAIVDHLGLTPDVYVRDDLHDTGDGGTGVLSKSPDVILRPEPVADPDAAFGDATADDDALGVSAIEGGDHVVYVRVRNRGPATARDVTVKVWWAEAATLVAPPWNLVGESEIEMVPPDGTFVVAPAIPLDASALPGPGHYCLVATVACADDPAPDPSAIADFAGFTDFIASENNAAWRNFFVGEIPIADGAPTPIDLPFFDARGDREREREMTLDVVGELPAGVGLMVDVPFDLHDAMRLAHPDGERYVDDDTGEARVRVPFEPAARGRPLGSATFGPRDRHRIRLRVTAGALAGREPFEVAVRQLHAGVPLGAVTWRLRPGPPTA